jgi:hypothetical protein
LKVSAYRGGVCDEGKYLHPTPAGRADIDLNFEHTGEQRSPRQSILAGAWFIPVVFVAAVPFAFVR